MECRCAVEQDADGSDRACRGAGAHVGRSKQLSMLIWLRISAPARRRAHATKKIDLAVVFVCFGGWMLVARGGDVGHAMVIVGGGAIVGSEDNYRPMISSGYGTIDEERIRGV